MRMLQVWEWMAPVICCTRQTLVLKCSTLSTDVRDMPYLILILAAILVFLESRICKPLVIALSKQSADGHICDRSLRSFLLANVLVLDLPFLLAAIAFGCPSVLILILAAVRCLVFAYVWAIRRRQGSNFRCGHRPFRRRADWRSRRRARPCSRTCGLAGREDRGVVRRVAA